MFDLASKYRRIFFRDDPDYRRGIKCNLLLSTIEKYLNGAIIEMRRMERVRKAMIKKAKERAFSRKCFSSTYLACDTHFYFICVDKIINSWLKLSEELNDNDIKKLQKKLNERFPKKIRNHLEHIDSRCVGKIKHGKEVDWEEFKKPILNFGCFHLDSGSFSFGSEKYSTNKESLSFLKQSYKELIEIIYKKYASKDPNFLEDEKQERLIKDIRKFLKKQVKRRLVR